MVRGQEVWMCLREQSMPEKYVRLVKDTYEDAWIHVKTSFGQVYSKSGPTLRILTEPLPVRHDTGCEGTRHQRAAP